MIIASTVATHFINNWIWDKSTPSKVLTAKVCDLRLSFSRLFAQSRGVVVNSYEITTFLTNKDNERINVIIVSKLRHYVVEHTKDLNTYTVILTYAYNI